jgi:hypothetical protein
MIAHRSKGVADDQAEKLRTAASAARLISAVPAFGNVPKTSSVAGLTTAWPPEDVCSIH